MASFYFRNFPITKYSFGTNEPEVYFQKLSSMVDLFNVVKQEAAYYTKQTIMDEERPDTLSYKLYGTVDYYWTFFLMNNHLRESGWPLTATREFEVIEERYPHFTMTTDSYISTTFPVGAEVKCSGPNILTTFATVVKRNLELGQIVVEPTGFAEDFEDGNPFKYEEDIGLINLAIVRTGTLSYEDGDDVTQTANVYRADKEYDSTHHFENSDGEYVDVDPFSQDRTGLVDITYKTRFKNKNDELKEIVVLRPGVINSVAGEFQKLIRS